MKKIFGTIAAFSGVGVAAMFNAAHADQAQIDALQNAVLELKQEMSKEKSKAYFNKGKGLSIKSNDGKYEFQIKGRLMADFSAILGGNDVLSNPSRADSIGTYGNEFRRARFSIKGKIGDGWGFAFQPDFAETVADNTNSTGAKGVDVKDALIYKGIKRIGKISIGNVKSAGGMWENTSSNSLLFMERPMYNEAANLAHRWGIHYDTAGAFGKPFHLKVTLGAGAEGAWRQEQEDSDTVEDRWVASVAAHYTQTLGKKHSLLIGGSWTYENLSDGNARDVEARANGVHTLGEKIQDGALADIEDYSYGGPQIAYTNGPLFAAAEYYYVRASRVANNSDMGQKQFDDFTANGYSAFVHYFVQGGANVKINNKKGGISGVKCKSPTGCTAVKLMFEGLNFAQDELSLTGTDGKVLHWGINHYFNSNVRIMVDMARGIYNNGTGLDSIHGATHNMTSLQTRLHLKF